MKPSPAAPPLQGWIRTDAYTLSDHFTLHVGEHPYKTREPREIQTGKAWIKAHFTATINVGDDGATLRHPVEGVPHYWHPIQEMSRWSYSSLFAVKRTLDYLLELAETGQPQRILLHCHGGVNRSQSLAQLWFESLAIEKGGPLPQVPKNVKGLREIEKNLRVGHLPPNTRTFYTAMNTYKTYGCMGVLQGAGADIYKEDIASPPHKPKGRTKTR